MKVNMETNFWLPALAEDLEFLPYAWRPWWVDGWREGSCRARLGGKIPPRPLSAPSFFILATHNSSLQMFHVSWFVDPRPRSQKSYFPHTWAASCWTWNSLWLWQFQDNNSVTQKRHDGGLSYPSLPRLPWCCFRRSCEHIVELVSFELSWLKKQTISVCFCSIFQVLLKFP